MVSPGNHEAECHSPACVVNPVYGLPLSNFTAYNARWHMPSDVSGGRSSMWYSFNVGPAHFVTINTETDFPGAGEEEKGDSGIPWLKAGGFGEEGEYLKWLEADLKRADEGRKAGGRRWLLVGGHRPYDSIHESGITELLEKYEVDIYFAGHSHSYARTLDEENKPMYVVVGGAGCDEMGPPLGSIMLGPDFQLGEELYGKENFVGDGSSILSDRLSIGKLDVSEAELKWSLIDSTTGDILDTVMIKA